MAQPVTLLVIANPAARYLKHLAKLPDSVRIVVGNRPDSFDRFDRALDEATILLNGFQPGDLLREVFPRAPRLQWVHSLSAGLDGVLFPELVASSVPLTNGRGVFAEALGEFAIAGMMFFAKNVRRLVNQQAAAKWEWFDIEMLQGRTLGIVGYGSIGRACAWRAKALDMRVVAVRRRPELSREDSHVDETFPRERLDAMLGECDYIALCAPLTRETRGLIGEPRLRALKPTAVLLNLGRGPVVEEASLIRALEEGWIRGAALDVFDKEPLPAAHPFWRMENVLLSPHCADHVPTWLDDAMQVFIDNFQRFRNGMPLANVVDKEAGY